MKRVAMVSLLLLGALAAYHVTAEEEEEFVIRGPRLELEADLALARGGRLPAPAQGTVYRVTFEFEGREYAVLCGATSRKQFSLNQSATVSSLDTTAGKTEKTDKTQDLFNVQGTLRLAGQNTLNFDYQLHVQRKITRAEVDGDGAETGRSEEEDINLQMTGSVPVSIDGRTELVLAEVPGKPLSVTIEPITDWGVGEVRPTPIPRIPNNPLGLGE